MFLKHESKTDKGTNTKRSALVVDMLRSIFPSVCTSSLLVPTSKSRWLQPWWCESAKVVSMWIPWSSLSFKLKDSENEIRKRAKPHNAFYVLYCRLCCNSKMFSLWVDDINILPSFGRISQCGSSKLLPLPLVPLVRDTLSLTPLMIISSGICSNACCAFCCCSWFQVKEIFYAKTSLR